MPDSHSQYSPEQLARCKYTSIAFALLAFCIGAAALLGWILDVEFLKRIHPTLVNMKANTAICLMLVAVSVILLQDRSASTTKRSIVQVFAIIVGLVGLITFTEHLFGWNAGIDLLLFYESKEQAGQSFPGRMGVAASLNFFFLGIALSFVDTPSPR